MELGGAAGGATLEYPGVVEAALHSTMAFEVPGRMIEFPVNEGDLLKKGDVIARLDPRDYEAALEKSMAIRKAAKAEFERRAELFRQGVDSKAVLEKAERNYDVTKASVVLDTKALEDAVLRAPFDGVVAQKLVKDFRNVQAKESILIFEDNSSLKVEIALPEGDYVRARPGLTMEERTARVQPEVVVSSLPGRSFPARIVEMATAADPVTRTFKVTLAFDRPTDANIETGMTAKAVIHLPDELTGAGTGVQVPAHAVRGDEAGDAYVWVVDPSSMEVRRRGVEVGEVVGTQIQILSGLEGSDLIAISGVAQLREGVRVRRLGE
jgi:RND family efflux transporter MFP subunit